MIREWKNLVVCSGDGGELFLVEVQEFLFEVLELLIRLWKEQKILSMKHYLNLLAVTVIVLFLVINADAYAMRGMGFSLADNSLDARQEPNYDYLARYMMSTKKRSCIRRNGSCDHRPSDCCYNSSCRCNLWGTNCRCQRMGLFQKWGK